MINFKLLKSVILQVIPKYMTSIEKLTSNTTLSIKDEQIIKLKLYIWIYFTIDRWY